MSLRTGQRPEFSVPMVPAAFRLGEPPEISKRIRGSVLKIQQRLRARLPRKAHKKPSPRTALILDMADRGRTRAEIIAASSCSRQAVAKILSQYRPHLRCPKPSEEVLQKRFDAIAKHRAKGMSWAAIGEMYYQCRSRNASAAAAKTFFVRWKRRMTVAPT